MEGTIYKTKEEVLRRAQEAIGIPMRDIDKTGRIQTGKGAIGTVLEESWFGYTPTRFSRSWSRAKGHTIYPQQERHQSKGTLGLQYHQLHDGISKDL